MRPTRVHWVLGQMAFDRAAFFAGLDPDHDTNDKSEGVNDIPHGSLSPGLPPEECDLVCGAVCARPVNAGFAGLVTAL